MKQPPNTLPHIGIDEAGRTPPDKPAQPETYSLAIIR